MKRHFGERVLAVVLSVFLSIALLPTTMVQAGDDTVTLTITTTSLTKGTADVIVKQDSATIAPTASGEGEKDYLVSSGVNVTVEVTVSLTDESSNELKTTGLSEGWNYAESKYTYTYSGGVSGATTLALEDDLFILPKQVAGTTRLTIDKSGNGTVKAGGSEVTSWKDVTSNTTFTLVPDVGSYVSGIQVGGSELSLDNGVTVNDDGSCEFTYTYENTKDSDTIQVTFAALSSDNVSLSDFTENTYYYDQSAEMNYINGEVTLKQEGKSVMMVASNASTTSYTFTSYTSVSDNFTGCLYVLNSAASDYSGVITAHNLNVIKDISRPEMKEANGDAWDASSSAWIGNNTGDTITITGKVSDGGSGIASVWYTLAMSEPDWDNMAGKTQVNCDGSGNFTINVEKNQILADDVDAVKCYICVRDAVGNQTTTAKSFGRDLTNPELNIQIDTKTNYKWFFIKTETIDVTVTAEDKQGDGESGASGIDKNTFKVYVDGTAQTINEDQITSVANGYEITLHDFDTDGHTIGASVKDKAGNEYTTYDAPSHVRKDRTDPTIVSVTPQPDTGLTVKEVSGNYVCYFHDPEQSKVKVKIQDNVGLQSCEWTTTTNGVSFVGDEYKTYLTERDLQGTQEPTLTTSDDDLSIVIDPVSATGEDNIVVTLTVTDCAGNTCNKTITFKQDTTAPVFDRNESHIYKADGVNEASVPDGKGAHYLDATNQTVKIVTGVSDADAGVSQVELYNTINGNRELVAKYIAGQTSSSVAEYNESEKKITFYNVHLNAENEFSLKAMDQQGNETPVTDLYSSENPVICDSQLPSLNISASESDGTYVKNPTGEATFYYGSDGALGGTDFTITAGDDRELTNLTVCVGNNNKSVSVTDTSNQTGDVIKKEISLSGSVISGWLDDNNRDVTFTATDISGNTTSITWTFIKDGTAPSISNAKIGNVTMVTKENATTITYENYYHAASVAFTSDVTDDAGAGIRSITYTRYNANKQPVGGSQVVTSSPYAYQIPANFKGYLKITVTDNVGNQNTRYTNGFVVVNSDTSNTVLTPAATQRYDTSGNPLYGTDTSVAVSVENTYAGIASITYRVTAPYDTEHNVAATTVTPGTAGWSSGTDATGMVTRLTGSIPITNNSNDIVVEVTVRDKAGVEKTVSKQVSVDKTAPSIRISYDNNNVDSANRYRADRTAFIVVQERNFNPADFQLQIANSNGTVPTISGWTDTIDQTNPDQNTHMATVTFAADGDYTMNLSYADMVAHAANVVDTQAFTIDKSAPVIQVSFDNNNALNDFYYAQGRTATITVNEHYFDPNRVSVTGTATNDGNPIAFPAVSGWSNQGDLHTATITFAADGDYQFTVTATDQAGNTSPAYVVSQFVIDQTIPTITFGGVEDQASYNDVVEPTITFEDVNYDRNNVNITLVGANQGQVNYGNNAGDSNNGQTITFGDFEHNADVDDIYTLTAIVTDLAGNQYEDSITFSVNRFGSNYELDASLQDINGKYIKEPIDVIFTETNVNTLNDGTSKIVVSTNGNPRTLTRGTDYQVQNTGGGGSWSRYTYTIAKDTFEADGTYIVSVYSEDTAGNINENDAEGKDAEITFGVDATAPVISMTNLEENGNYNATDYEAVVNVSDNLVLEDVSIQLNGQKVEAQVSNDNYSFTIPESSDRQTVTVVATDAAGNQFTQEVSGIVVTTNAFVRMFNNVGVVVGVVAGVVVVGGVGIYLAMHGGIGALRFGSKKNAGKKKK